MTEKIITMNAKDFIELWEEFIKQLNSQEAILKDYMKDAKWTTRVLGLGGNTSTESPLGNYVNDHSFLEYRTEDSKIDIAFGQKDDIFNDIHKFRKKEDVINKDNFYPKVYQVIIEHENVIDNCWQEMMKLSYFRARLKVLITYNWHKDNGDGIEKIKDNFTKIIGEANRELQEDKQTEYLLIIGHRKDDSVIEWHNLIYSFDQESKLIVSEDMKWKFPAEDK